MDGWPSVCIDELYFFFTASSIHGRKASVCVVHKWKLSKTRENYSMMPSAQDWKKSRIQERKVVYTHAALEKSIIPRLGALIYCRSGVGAIIM